ncbi:hypothetical protein [Cohaesibacter sp. ES.047]|uniref:hypothetical protein n=1 Tax=Cohaesibacter sp. ES.047 TaxID=1798205 RepID=UPI0012FD3355|nr:hypothetical protein [Cohaesibacter sp. ES.047]
MNALSKDVENFFFAGNGRFRPNGLQLSGQASRTLEWPLLPMDAKISHLHEMATIRPN